MLEFLANIFLQTLVEKSDDLTWIAILIAGISAAGVITGLMLNFKRLGSENNARYIQITREFVNDLLIQYEKEDNVKTLEQADQYAVAVLNILSRIAHLRLLGKIPNYTTDFFEVDFKFGKLLLDWYDNVGLSKIQPAEKTWVNLSKWCSKNSITASPEGNLPKMLSKMLSQARAEEKKFLIPSPNSMCY